MQHLLLLACRCQSSAASRACRTLVLHPAVAAALDLLGRGTELPLEDLSRRCAASPAYLSRLFAREVGTPLTRYRQALRLEKFWNHYRRPPRKTMAEAAYAAGFGSYAQFYKVFRQAYGRGPREGSTPES